MKKFVVDRIEGSFAVCENDNLEMVDIPLVEFGFPVSEGDIVSYDGKSYSRLPQSDIDEIRQRNIDLQNSLFED